MLSAVLLILLGLPFTPLGATAGLSSSAEAANSSHFNEKSVGGSSGSRPEPWAWSVRNLPPGDLRRPLADQRPTGATAGSSSSAELLLAQMPDRSPMSDADPMPDAGSLSDAPLNTSDDEDDTAASGPKRSPLVAAWLDAPTVWLLGVVVTVLMIAFSVGRVLRRQPENFINPALVRTFNKRVLAYWMMCAILAIGVIMGPGATVILFALVSFWALREFITMTPTRRSDHRALFWTFFALTPLQYVLVAYPSIRWLFVGNVPPGQDGDLYDVYSIMIPVYASLLIPARIAFAGDAKRFLERSAKIQAGLMICVYSLSYAPALLYLKLAPGVDAAGKPLEGYWGHGTNPGSMAGLLFYFVLVTQLGDVLSYAWGKLLGQHVIAPGINASKTWEGLIGGTLSTTLIGGLLWWVTPFPLWVAALMSAAIALMGFAGGMTMSAIKRDRGVRDYGTLVTGHAGVLDRIDSICFAAPVFFHLTRVFYSA